MKRLLAIMGVMSMIVGTAGIAAAVPSSDTDRPGVTYELNGDPTAASIAAFVAGPVGGTIAGEGALPNACIGLTQDACTGNGNNTIVPATAVQHVDYVVTNLGGGLFRYEYQFENSSISHANIVTINNTNWLSISTAAGDLDTLGPNNLVGESENAPDCCTTVTPDAVPGENATWNCPPTNQGACAVGDETIRMVLIGGAPIFSHTFAQNFFQWSSLNGNPLGGELGRRVLAPGPFVPVPEPATLLLLGTGLLGLGFASRRRK